MQLTMNHDQSLTNNCERREDTNDGTKSSHKGESYMSHYLQGDLDYAEPLCNAISFICS